MVAKAVVVAIIQAVVTVASIVYQRMRARKLAARSAAAADAQKGFQFVTEESSTPIPVVYGRAKIGGTRVYSKVSKDFNYAAPASGGGTFLSTGDTRSPGLGPPSSITIQAFSASSYQSAEDIQQVNLTSLSIPGTHSAGVISFSLPPTTFDATPGLKARIVGLTVLVTYDGEQYPLEVLSFNTTTGAMTTGLPAAQIKSYSPSMNSSINDTKREFLYTQQVLCFGGINEIYWADVDDKSFDDPSYDYGLRIHYYKDGSVADPMATANGIPSTNTFSNLAYVSAVFRLNRDEPNYNGNIPNIQLYVEGMKIYGVTSGYNLTASKRYSNNPAEVLLDYLLNPIYGRGLTIDDVDLKSFYDASVICDTIVETNKPRNGKLWLSKGSQRDIKLYECNLILDTSKPFRENIELILESMIGAELLWSAGKYKLSLTRPTVWNPAITYTLGAHVQYNTDLYRCTVASTTATPGSSSDWVASGVSMLVTDDHIDRGYQFGTVWPSGQTKLNFCTVKYLNESKDFAEDTVSWPIKSGGIYLGYIAEDNNVPLEKEVFATGITDQYHALALAQFTVRQSRDSVIYSYSAVAEAADLEPGDIIKVNSVDFGIPGELMKVESVKAQNNTVVDLQAIKYSAMHYRWDLKDTEPAFTRNVYDYELLQASNLSFTELGYFSTTSSGVLRWDAPLDNRVRYYRIMYTTNSPFEVGMNTVWQEIGTTSDTRWDTPSVPIGFYTLTVVAVAFNNRTAPRQSYITNSKWPVISAKVTVTPNTATSVKLELSDAAFITTASVIAPSSITLTAVVTNVVSPIFEWYIDGLIVPGAVTSSFVLPSFAPLAAKIIKVRVTNSFGADVNDTAVIFSLEEGAGNGIIKVEASSLGFIFADAVSTVSTTPQCELTAVLSGIVGTVTWSTEAFGISGLSLGTVPITTNGNLASMTYVQFMGTFGADVRRVKVSAAIGTVSDYVFLYRGDTLGGIPQIVFEDPSVLVPSDADGSNPVLTDAKTLMYVFEGVTDKTDTWTFSIFKQTGCKATITGNGSFLVTLQLTEMAADTAVVEVLVSKPGFLGFTDKFYAVKNKGSYSHTLNPDTITLPVDSSGNVISWNSAESLYSVKTGTNNEDSQNWTFSLLSNGVAASFTPPNKIKVSGFTSTGVFTPNTPGEDPYYKNVVALFTADQSPDGVIVAPGIDNQSSYVRKGTSTGTTVSVIPTTLLGGNKAISLYGPNGSPRCFQYIVGNESIINADDDWTWEAHVLVPIGTELVSTLGASAPIGPPNSSAVLLYIASVSNSFAWSSGVYVVHLNHPTYPNVLSVWSHDYSGSVALLKTNFNIAGNGPSKIEISKNSGWWYLRVNGVTIDKVYWPAGTLKSTHTYRQIGGVSSIASDALAPMLIKNIRETSKIGRYVDGSPYSLETPITGGGMVPDPFYLQREMICHLDSSPLIDTSSRQRTITLSGGGVISTLGSLFGQGAYYNGSSVPTSGFSVENINTTYPGAGFHRVWSIEAYYLHQSGLDGVDRFLMHVGATTPAGTAVILRNNVLHFRIPSGSILSTGFTMVPNVAYHIRLQANLYVGGTDSAVFVNGSQVFSISGGTFPQGSGVRVTFGTAGATPSASNQFMGWIEEPRITQFTQGGWYLEPPFVAPWGDSDDPYIYQSSDGTGYVDVTASKSGQTSVTKRLSVSKGQFSDATTLKTSKSVITLNSDFAGNVTTYTGANTVLSVLRGSVPEIGWVYTAVAPPGATITIAGDLLSVTSFPSGLPNGTIVVTATKGNVSITASVEVIKNNVTPTVVSNTFPGSFALPATSDGIVVDYSGCSASMQIWISGLDTAASWTFATAASDPGITYTGINTSSVTVTSMSQSLQTGWIRFTASRTNFPTQVVYFNLSKARGALASGPTGSSFSNFYNNVSPIGIRLKTDGRLQVRKGAGAYVDASYWYYPTTPGIGSSYWIKMVATGDTLSSGTLNVFTSLSTDQTYELSRGTPGNSLTNLKGYIGDDSLGGNIVVGTGVLELDIP